MSRPRDAARTRQLLLDAALRRFGREGYAATTVRDIAEDAGVNVALIARYFESKEGLYGAALQEAVDELGRESQRVPRSRIPEMIAHRVAGPNAEGGPDLLLLLLLRSTKDERMERLRVGVLRRFSESLADAAGGPQDNEVVLRSELVLATAVGITLLRYCKLEPLTAANEKDLVEPLRDVVNALLPG
jgi:AcrR family transcriptional regulator